MDEKNRLLIDIYSTKSIIRSRKSNLDFICLDLSLDLGFENQCLKSHRCLGQLNRKSDILF